VEVVRGLFFGRNPQLCHVERRDARKVASRSRNIPRMLDLRCGFREFSQNSTTLLSPRYLSGVTCVTAANVSTAIWVDLHFSALLQPAAPDVSTTSSHSLRLLQHDNANFAQSNLSPGWIAREGPSVKCERTKPALQAATPYSYLNATVGFTRVARRAGIKHAVNATSTSRNVTAASASGSTEPILKSTLER
jgi:hypothetical protein